MMSVATSFLAFSSSFLASALSIISKNASVVKAFLSLETNSSSISIVASFDNISKCTLPEFSGAAIRNTKSTALPSRALYSTPPLILIAARPAFLTPEHLPCGMAMPPPTPVVPSSSLAFTASR